MGYKYEPHLHTSEGSACGVSSGAEMAQACKDAGYTGIIVTDHFFNGNCAVPYDLFWEEKVERFCLGYEHAKQRGDEIGLDVFFGWEYTYLASDFLTYGLDKAWLKAHPEIMDMKIYEYADFVRSEGGFIVHAHPFRNAFYIKQMTLIPNDIDAVEIINMGNSSPVYDERARWYAESYGLPVTEGSDVHSAAMISGNGIELDKKFETVRDYFDAVKERKIKLL